MKLHHQKVCESIVENIIRHTETLEAYVARLSNGANDASSVALQDTANLFRKLTDNITILVPIAVQPTASSAVKAQELFDTPELLEEILLYMDTKENLSGMGVQRAWRDTVVGSPRLNKACSWIGGGQPSIVLSFSVPAHRWTLQPRAVHRTTLERFKTAAIRPRGFCLQSSFLP